MLRSFPLHVPTMKAVLGGRRIYSNLLVRSDHPIFEFMQNRRHFLGLGVAGVNALFFSRYLTGCAPSTLTALNFGLFAQSSDLASLRKLYRRDPMFAALRERHAAFDRDAERAFIATEVQYNDHLFHLGRLGQTAEQMSFVYLMTEDAGAAEIAIAAVRAIMKFPRWDYFLEGGIEVLGIQRASSSVVGVSLACDWLGDFITHDDRDEWLGIMGDRGCEACFRSIYGMRYPEKVVGWTMDKTSTYLEHRPGDLVDLKNWPYILDKTNLKAVPASALVIGALAYEQQFGKTEQGDRWLEQGLFSVDSFKDLFSPDGSYNEGVSYANYTTTHLIQAIDVVNRFRGDDHYDIINWNGYLDYLLGLSMPIADDPYAIVNISDAGGGVSSAVPFYIAGRTDNGAAKWFGQNLAREHNEWSLMWHPAAVVPAPPIEEATLWKSDLDWIVARTGYSPDDLVVAMRSGGPSNHEHADRNSIMLKCFGEKLVVDPYRPPYSFSDPSWILRTSVGHSGILIDGKGHQYHDGSEGTNPSDATAVIVSSNESDLGMQWTSDATPAYKLVNANVEMVSRSVAISPANRTTIVVDKVVTKRPARVTARFFADNMDGKASVEASAGATFVIRRPGAWVNGLSVTTKAEPGTVAGQLDIPAETAVLHPFIDVAATASRLTILVTVLQPKTAVSDDPGPSITKDPATGNIVVIFADGTSCRISDTDSHPSIQLSA